MDQDQALSMAQLCPYMILPEVCEGGHLHILGGFLSPVPPGPDEQDAFTNIETSDTLRVRSHVTWSLN